MNINQGIFKEDKYIKKVQFSKAVLWKDRELSLGRPIVEKIEENKNIKEIHFIDDIKRETWIFKRDDILDGSYLKQVGQEPQYYFSIQSAKKVLHNQQDPINAVQSMAKFAGSSEWEKLREKLHSK